MKATILSDSKPFVNALNRFLDALFYDTEAENLIIIDVNSVLSEGHSRQERSSLSLAKEYVNDSNNIVILLSVEKESSLMKNNRHFAGLMSLPNVGFVSILAIHGIFSKYRELKEGCKVQDNTGVAIYAFQELEHNIAILRHNYSHASEDDLRLGKWLEKCRAVGLVGTDAEIIDYVQNWHPETSGEFAGKFLDGIFVDALDTLFNHDWQLNNRVREAIEKMSLEIGKKIMVISDSESSLVKRKLSENNLPWPHISKYVLRGASLEVVIDNLSQEEFLATYNIIAQKFIKVEDL
ncbi:MAG: hypothetical protein WC456_01650 [Patescibacteria group bacterium]